MNPTDNKTASLKPVESERDFKFLLHQISRGSGYTNQAVLFEIGSRWSIFDESQRKRALKQLSDHRSWLVNRLKRGLARLSQPKKEGKTSEDPLLPDPVPLRSVSAQKLSFAQPLHIRRQSPSKRGSSCFQWTSVRSHKGLESKSLFRF